MASAHRPATSRPLRLVAHDAYWSSQYGAQRSMMALLDGLRASEDFDVVLLVDRPGALACLARRHGLPVLELPTPDRLTRFDHALTSRRPSEVLRNAFSLMRHNIAVLRTVIRLKPDIVYANSVRSALTFAFVRIARRAPLVLYIRGGDNEPPFSFFAAALAERILLISNAAGKALPPRFRASRKTKTVYVGVPVASLRQRAALVSRQAVLHDLGIDPSQVVLIQVASICRRKGQDVLLDAIAQLPSAARGRITLVLVGAPDTEAGEDFLRELSVREAGCPVIQTGWVEDPIPFLRSADIFVMASREEGLGRAILEAMAIGLPPIVTRAGGSEETVVHGESGLVVEPGSALRLAQAIEYLVDHPVARRDMGEAAAHRASEVFDESHYVESVAHELRRACAPPRE